MKKYLLDIETSDYQASKITLICLSEVGSPHVKVIENPTDETLRVQAPELFECNNFIGHNIIGFDWPVLTRHFPTLNGYGQTLYDTLVVSRLLYFRIDGGHSLEAWGTRLGLDKLVQPDLAVVTPALIEYCKRDVEILGKLYDFQSKYRTDPNWHQAFRTEHDWAELCQQMHKTGFKFDTARAAELQRQLKGKLDEIIRTIKDTIPPKTVRVKEVTPKKTKSGHFYRRDFTWLRSDDLSAFTEGAPFTVIERVPFNPSSVKQCVELLYTLGWQPTEKTKGHIEFLRGRGKKKQEDREHYLKYGWKVSEVNLASLPETGVPEGARLLALFRSIERRINMIDQWQAATREDGRIHGSIMSIGTWPHRVTHTKPNIGNIVRPFNPKNARTPVEEIKGEFDAALRGLWIADSDALLCGVDIASAHLRILAHLIDDDAFRQSLLAGDPHSFNLAKLQPTCPSRDAAKVFIYTWLNGGKAPKVAQIFKCTVDQAEACLEAYANSIPGLGRLLNETIPADANRGWFIGIDGRKVEYNAEHGMLAGYLQNAEAILLRTAAIWTTNELVERALPARLINAVHDELQFECFGDKELATLVGDLTAANIRKAGLHYQLRCPIDADYKIGKNWKESH
jgi:DNA polymerase I-like protein with 3'-5' exonuclease and polymerase domains